jgi:hypothetical protein
MQERQGNERETYQDDGGEAQQIFVDKTPRGRLGREDDRPIYSDHLPFCPYHIAGI